MIEELLERYFEGETSAAEEKQIRAFFASGEVPEHLAWTPNRYPFRSALRTGSVQPFTSFPAWQLVYWLCWELPACCIPLIPVSVPTAMS